MLRKLLTLSFCGLLAFTVAEARHVELVVGAVDQTIENGSGEEDDTGTAYAIALDNPLGDSGWLTGHVKAERVGSFDDTPTGAYLLDVDLLVNLLKNKNWLDFDLGGGLGGVFGDIGPREETVTVTNGEETVTGTAEIADEDTFLTGNATARLMVWFSKERNFGAGVEYRYRFPLDEDQMLEKSASTTVYLSIPLAQ